MVRKISLGDVAKRITERWRPLEVARVNETSVKLVKLQGEFHWHKHSKEDEFFLVLNGKIVIDFEHARVELSKGEGYLVKRGTMHRTSAKKEATVLVVEPVTTLREGD